jgi:hypothetical protein
MTIPNFFIVGMPRSGTTSLYTYLKQHRQIFLSIYKEPLFFCKDLDHRPHCITSETVYRSLFEGADGYGAVGEGSVWYLTSEVAAREIHKVSPRAGIVVMLRDPLQMIQSLHSLYVRTGNEDIEDFAAALEAQEDRRAGLRIPARNYFTNGLLYSDVARYYPKLKRFYDVFGKERIHVIKFEDFAADPLEECRKVFRFLEIDADAPVELDLGAAKRIIRPRAMEQIRRAHPEVKAKLSRKMGKTHLGAKRKPLDKNVEQTLRRMFREDLTRTGELTGLDLSAWGPADNGRD